MIDFERTNREALNHLETLLPELLPGGRTVGREYCCGDLAGGSGKSFKVNMDSGKWADFADEVKGGDPVSLVAAVRQWEQGDAARWLEEWLGINRPAPSSLHQRSADTWKTIPAPAPPNLVNHSVHGTPSTTWEYRGAAGELLGIVCRFNLKTPPQEKKQRKEILPYTYGTDATGKFGWRWKSWPAPRPLYGLDRLAQRTDSPVLVVEGEKKADAAQRLLPSVVAVAWPGGCNATGKANFSPLKGRRVAIWPDNDKPGFKAADSVAQAVLAAGAKEVFIVDLPSGKFEGWDLADAETEGWTTEQVVEWIKEHRRKKEAAAPVTNQQGGQDEVPVQLDPAAMIQKLAGLPTVEYEMNRKAAAEVLGIRAIALDQAVKESRKTQGQYELPFDEPDLWPEPVKSDQLLTEIAGIIQRFIVCSPEVANTVALWSAMTWFMEVVEVAPLAIITAPEKRCGKSQLLFLLGRLSARSITASSISPAALFRVIDAWRPTLLIDEADAFMKDNEELRGIINSGHTRDSAHVIRTVGDNHVPTTFNTWGAKAIAGIGHVADTLMDRAVILELRRKLPHESVDRLRYAEPNLFSNLRSKLTRFSNDYSEQVRQARPPLPASLNDRAQDNWEPLLAIAMVAGGNWLEIGTAAALKLNGNECAAQTIGTELLADIKEIFEMKGTDRISTADLIKALCEDDEKLWATYNRGTPIKPRQLASKLKGYGINSTTLRFRLNGLAKGYEREQFEEAFSRYIPCVLSPFSNRNSVTRAENQQVESVTPSVTDGHVTTVNRGAPPANSRANVTDRKNVTVAVTDRERDKFSILDRCYAVTDRPPLMDDNIIEVEI